MREKYDTFDIRKKNRESRMTLKQWRKFENHSQRSLYSDATCKANDKSVIN